MKGDRPAYLTSIIIPVFNKVEYTRDCLVALSENTDGENYEVIIVDNASSDGTGDFLEHLEGDVTIITNKKNLGFAKACNQGAMLAKGEYLLFLNNDTIPSKGWLTEMLKVVDPVKKIAVVGSKLLYPDTGLIQHAGIVFGDLKEPYHIYKNLPAEHPAVNRLVEFQAVTAACMLIDKTIFQEAGMFDEIYMNGYEDIDLCLKVRELGYKIIYAPSSILSHAEFTSEGRTDYQDKNLTLFLKRWKRKIMPDEDKYYSSNGHSVIYDIDDRRKFTVLICQ